MKKAIILFCTCMVSLATYAQEMHTKKSFFTIQASYLTGSSTMYENQGFGAGGTGDTFRLGALYGFHLLDKFDLSAGIQLHPIASVREYRGDVVLLPITIDAHYKFKEKPKTTFFYVNYGVSPKLGGNFYAGTTFGLGLGWQYQPKFLNSKTLSFAAGYNLNRIKNVYTSVTSSYGGSDFTTEYYYYTYRLPSLALTVGVSF